MATAQSSIARELAELIEVVAKEAPPSLGTCQTILHFLQHHHIHRPDLIVRFTSALIRHHSRALKEKVWEMHERRVVAALDTSQDTIASQSLHTLVSRFGESSLRVQRLVGMRCEWQGRWSDATAIYESLLQKDPTHAATHKRLVAIHTQCGQYDRAIVRLTKYTRVFASDESGWLMLGQLYLNQQQFQLAQFCYEELILIAPENAHYHILAADALFSQHHYDRARQYYAQSVELKTENNLRALYGMLAAIKAKPAPVLAQLYAWTAAKLTNHYKKYAPAMLETVQQSLGFISETRAIDADESDVSEALVSANNTSGLRERVVAKTTTIPIA